MEEIVSCPTKFVLFFCVVINWDKRISCYIRKTQQKSVFKEMRLDHISHIPLHLGVIRFSLIECEEKCSV